MMSIATKMNTVGNSILSGALFACSSALWSRRSRMPSACTRSVSARPVPKRSVWISIATSELTSATPVRSASARSASVVLLPARVSKLASSNSDGEDRMRGAEVLRHALEAGVDAEARLDAHDHQVERVGQREPERLLARLHLLVEPVARRDQADPGRGAQRERRAGAARASRPPASASTSIGSSSANTTRLPMYVITDVSRRKPA